MLVLTLSVTNEDMLRAIDYNNIDFVMHFRHYNGDKGYYYSKNLKYISIRDYHRIVQTNFSNENDIVDLINQLRMSNKLWSWIVGPTSKPYNLCQILEQNHFKKQAELTGMYLDLNNLGTDSATDFQVKKVCVNDDIDDWFDIFIQGFGITAKHSERIKTLRYIYTELINEENQLFHMYLGIYKNKPSVCCSTFAKNGNVGIYDLATIPDMRRKRLASSMINSILNQFRSDGNRFAVATATDSGELLFTKLGFTPVGKFPLYKISQGIVR